MPLLSAVRRAWTETTSHNKNETATRDPAASQAQVLAPRAAPVAVVEVLTRLKVLSHQQVLLGVHAERLDRHRQVRGAALAVLVGVRNANLPADEALARPFGLGVTALGFLRLLLVPASSSCYSCTSATAAQLGARWTVRTCLVRTCVVRPLARPNAAAQWGHAWSVRCSCTARTCVVS